jgi:predicted secreted protein
MTDAAIGHGSFFRMVNVGVSPLALAALDEVIEIGPPNETIDLIDATHMQSPDRRREFISGLKDGGDATVVLNYIPGNTSESIILAAKTAAVAVGCQIEFPDGSTWDFDAIVTGYEPSLPIDDKMTLTVTMKVTGATDITAVT